MKIYFTHKIEKESKISCVQIAEHYNAIGLFLANPKNYTF